MATPTHPNQFAIGQEVLFRLHDDALWREGVIHGVTSDEREDREDHSDKCDEVLYVIADDADAWHLREERKRRLVKECQCDVMIAAADSTGRWHGQRLGGAIGLQLLLVDTMRRKAHVATDPAVSEVDDEGDPDVVRLLEMPGYHHLASARVDDLVEWASGIPAAKWKVPVE